MKNRIIRICWPFYAYRSRAIFLYEQELLESDDMISWSPISINALKYYKDIFIWEE